MNYERSRVLDSSLGGRSGELWRTAKASFDLFRLKGPMGRSTLHVKYPERDDPDSGSAGHPLPPSSSFGQKSSTQKRLFAVYFVGYYLSIRYKNEE